MASPERPVGLLIVLRVYIYRASPDGKTQVYPNYSYLTLDELACAHSV